MPNRTDAPAGRLPGQARVRGVLFDLDGTLADTAPDLIHALNRLRQQEGMAPLPDEPVRLEVSNGSDALVRLGFGIEHTHPRFNALRDQLLDLYLRDIARHTRLFPGMGNVLATLEQRGLRWGVVTNKPAFLTEPLMRALDLHARAACIISGDSASHSKPNPAPLLLACRQLGIAPAESIYIGDAERDIEAGQRAGMRTLVALFGYLPPQVDPAHWSADAMIETPGQLLDWLKNTEYGQAGLP